MMPIMLFLCSSIASSKMLSEGAEQPARKIKHPAFNVPSMSGTTSSLPPDVTAGGRRPPSPPSRPGDSGAKNPCGTATPAISVISDIYFSS
jgi:hypothetical protein